MEKTYSFQKLADFVWGFATKQSLFGPGSDLAIGLSGGADSRLLLELAYYWREQGMISGLRALHYNHRVRARADLDAEFVKKLAASLDVELIIGAPEIKPEVKSEDYLRELRYDFFKHNLKRGELLLLGHHLDDSFEWSLRQLVRTSKPESILGIPNKSGRVRRPLMCLSRAQIEYASELFELEHCHDESNDDLAFERNYLRHEVVPKLRVVGPSLLKNYVRRNNELAKRFGLSSLNQSRANSSHEYILKKWPNSPVYYLTWSNDLRLGNCEAVIREALGLLSVKKRGMWREQIERLIESVDKKWAGPFSFSGGVRAIVTPGRITFYPQSFEAQLVLMVQEGGEAGPNWLFTSPSSAVPKIPASHILSKWFGNSRQETLMTIEQLPKLRGQLSAKKHL